MAQNTVLQRITNILKGLFVLVIMLGLPCLMTLLLSPKLFEWFMNPEKQIEPQNVERTVQAKT